MMHPSTTTIKKENKAVGYIPNSKYLMITDKHNTIYFHFFLYKNSKPFINTLSLKHINIINNNNNNTNNNST